MEEYRVLVAIYPPENVLNMDETGLFWKLSPSYILVIEAGSGGKKSKDRITVALTINTTGTDKWELWIVGKLKDPCYFTNINYRLLGIQYRYNNFK
jgi:hypothetical protein